MKLTPIPLLAGTLASVLADRFLAPSATGLHVKER